MVFIHGLGGDYSATWRHGDDDSTSWPHWLAEEFPEVGVWCLGYAASPSKWARVRGFLTGDRDAGYSMPLPDRAGQVLDLLVQNGFGDRPLLFICHSLGGLLFKQILRKADDAIDERKKQVAVQTRAVLFLATPHAGATLASLVDTFPSLLGSTVSMKDLRVDDSHLRDLDDWYRIGSVGLGIQTASYFEQRSVKGVLPIVGPTSARPGVGADPVGLDEDHLSIAKPRDRDAQVCAAASSLLRIYVLARLPVARMHRQPSGASATEAPRVPCELPPAAEKHFGRQTELKQLTDRLRAGKNSAVVGPAGMGKTALAAEALREVVSDSLADSPYPDGVVFLDLYSYRGLADPVWNNLANALRGPEFRDSSPARERATEACRTHRVLIILEGGEEADGKDGRSTISELCSVFSPQNRYLLMTRLSTQAVPAESVQLKEALYPEDAARLFDSLTSGRVTGAVREQVLALVEGHPLALTWASGLLARDDDDPEQLAKDWQARGTSSLSDPKQTEHTLEWLFNRSARGLDDTARQLLAAAGLFARMPFPLSAMVAALDDISESDAIARAALKSLVQRSLLRRSEEPDHWQFTHVLGYRFARKETGSDPALRERLGHWLSGHLQAATANSLGHEGALSLTRALEHAAALLRVDDDQRLWIPLANDFLYDISDRLTMLGRLDLVGLALDAVAGWLVRFPAVTAQKPSWLRERSTLIGKQGDLLRQLGDLEGALTAYRESLTVFKQLAATDPPNALWQSDLSRVQERIGNVLSDQGDLIGALVAHRESLALRQRLAQADPSNTRDLSVSHNKVGDALREQGDLAAAMSAYQASLALRRPLAQADPSNAARQLDLVLSQERIGDVLLDKGDLAGALESHWECMTVRQRLAETDPSNAAWQRNLSASKTKVGDILREQNDHAGALAAYTAALSIMRRLADADMSNARWQRDLSFILTRLAEFHEAQGSRVKACQLAEESLKIDERLAALDSTNITWQDDLVVSRDLVGRLRDGEPSNLSTVPARRSDPASSGQSRIRRR